VLFAVLQQMGDRIGRHRSPIPRSQTALTQVRANHI
jgi:hypothetical protein